MSKNIALVVKESLSPLTLDTVERWKPAAGEVLVKVKATALNPVDWKVQQGYLNNLFQFPAVLGWDIAGDVEELGEGVRDSRRAIGCQFAISNKSGYQQYTTSLASTLARIPPNISHDQAASIPVGLMAAYVGLFNSKPHGFGFDKPGEHPDKSSKYSSTPLLILGGSSSVGQYAIQLAKLSGFSPIITTASLKHADALKDFGADHVLSRSLSTEELRAEIGKITSKPLDQIFDTVSLQQTQHTAIELLAPNGYLITTLDNVVEKIDDGKTSIRVWGVLRKPENIELLEDLFQNRLTGWLEKGYLKPNPVEVLPNGLLGIVDGLKRLENDQVSRLKLVARPHETVSI